MQNCRNGREKISGKPRTYYVLKPEDGGSATLYIPADSEKLLAKMRRILSKEEVYALIDSMPNTAPIWIEKDADRKAAFGKILASGEPSALLSIMKALYLRRKDLEAAGKHLRMSDERILKEAEGLLYHELQYVLGMDRDTLMAHIFARINNDNR